MMREIEDFGKRKDFFISETVESLSVIVGGQLYEQIYAPDTGNAYFVALKDGLQFLQHVDDIKKGIRYVPCINEDIKKRAIILPSNINDYGSKDKLLEEIKAHLHKYIDMPEIYEDLCSWYIMMTWLYDKLPSIPYLRFLGDYQTGKTRALKVVAGLCYHPLRFINPSDATIFRTIEKYKPTLCLDEFEIKYSDKNSAIIQILNAGYEKGNCVPRCNLNNPDEIKYYDVYCPKIIANKTRFKDPSLENRCLTVIMKTTSRNDIPRNLTEEFEREQEKLRNKLLMFRLRNYNEIDLERAQSVNLGNIDIRLQQIMEGIIAIFADMPDVVERIKYALVQHHKSMVEERANSFDGRIVNAIWQLHDKGVKRISVKDIMIKLLEDYEEYRQADFINPQAIGQRLKKLGVKTRTQRTGDGIRKCIQWDEELMQQLKRRYMIVEDVSDVLDVANDKQSDELLQLEKRTEKINDCDNKGKELFDSLTPTQKNKLREYIKMHSPTRTIIDKIRWEFGFNLMEATKLLAYAEKCFDNN